MAPIIRPIHDNIPITIGNLMPSKLLKLKGLQIHQEISSGETLSITISRIISTSFTTAHIKRNHFATQIRIPDNDAIVLNDINCLENQ